MNTQTHTILRIYKYHTKIALHNIYSTINYKLNRIDLINISVMVFKRERDRQGYFKSSNIPKTEDGQTSPYLCKWSYDLHEILLTHKGIMDEKYFTGSMSLLTPNNTFKTCGGPNAVISTTI